MATARRYALTAEDAEDAYQRGLEILLTKAPSTSADDLVPWLKTVVKHEAFALRKQREKHGVPTEHDDSAPGLVDTHEHVERLDQLQRGAEAMQRLKPQEVRCMLLLAEGHSYAEICAITGFSYTKVNRCLAEGRLSFMKRVDGIETGAGSRRLAPLVSAAADGEAGAEEMLVVRRHLRSCLACRASLREARAVPARVAALAPAGIVLAPDAGQVHAAWTWLHDRISAIVIRSQEIVELATTHKTVAVAASAAALAGGGAATVKTVVDHPQPKPAHHAAAMKPVAAVARASTRAPQRPSPAKARAHTRASTPRAPEPTPVAASPRPAVPHDAAPPARTSPSPRPAAGSGAGEFGP